MQLEWRGYLSGEFCRLMVCLLEKMTLPQGTQLGRYEIHSKIGSGGMGEVYLAEDTRLNHQVALKLLPAELTDHKDRLRRFEQEARSTSALNHPNIVTIHENGLFQS